MMRQFLRWMARSLTDWLNRTEPIQCTGVSASWCPVCGDCICRNPDDSLSDDDCPLHSMASIHAELKGGAT